jgi:hypothetical protein
MKRREEHLLFASPEHSRNLCGHEILSEETGGRARFFSRLGYGGYRSSAEGEEWGGGKTPP